MASDLSVAPTAVLDKPLDPNDIGFDRALAMTLARVPLTAIGWAGLAHMAALVWAAAVPVNESNPLPNCGAILVICFGMVLAAAIDGYAFKVPNWLTLSLVVGGWYLGLLHDFNLSPETGAGGIAQALLCTAIGFLVLFPALFIGGMGQGDVKMTMGFGSWMGAIFGAGVLGMSGAGMTWWSFALGVIIGGAFGLLIMALRRDIHKNVQNFRAIAVDLQTLVSEGPAKAAERANSRRKDWVRLPYGVPLCVGFLGYLWYRLYLDA